MAKGAGGWGQMGELPDQVTETGGRSPSQRPLPQPAPPPGWRDSCSGEDRAGIHCISLSLSAGGQTWVHPSHWGPGSPGPSSPPPADPGVLAPSPSSLKHPPFSFCPQCICLNKGAVSPVDGFLRCGGEWNVRTSEF